MHMCFCLGMNKTAALQASQQLCEAALTPEGKPVLVLLLFLKKPENVNRL